MPTTDHDPIDFTFADDGDLVRKAPNPNGAPERDPAKRKQRSQSKVANRVVTEAEVQRAAEDEYTEAWVQEQRAKVADRFGESELKWRHRMGMVAPFEKSDAVARGEAMHRAIEIRHGSGKVKV